MGLIKFFKKELSDEEIWKGYNDFVVEWFKKKYVKPTPPQRPAFYLIKRGYNVLISSPTGSGKTLSAFLSILDDLYSLSIKRELEDKVYAIYVSPLRALNNDIRRNLETPIKEINEILKEKGIRFDEIRIGVRTSDIKSYEKQKQLKKPPHILITTPESLAIILNTKKFSKHINEVKWVIVDEIHEIASSKRGTHLSLSLERLSYRVIGHTGDDFQRIGLSATIYPLEEVAKFFVGEGRSCYIIDTTAEKKIKVRVVMPTESYLYSQEELDKSLYEFLYEVIKKSKSTLIFTNTRYGAESVAWKLKTKFEDLKDSVGVHHSSLDRDVRLSVEEKLKSGSLKVVVCVPRGTNILTEKGYIPIEHLNNNIKIYGFKGGNIILQNFSRVCKISGKFLGYRIKLENGEEFIATKDHKVLVKEKDGKLVWKKMEEVKVGDKVIYVSVEED